MVGAGSGSGVIGASSLRGRMICIGYDGGESEFDLLFWLDMRVGNGN